MTPDSLPRNMWISISEDVDLPANFLEEYPYNEAAATGRELRDEMLAPFPRTEYAVKVNRQEYYAIITHMDYQIGRILEHLKKTKQDRDTYIIFTADHGLAVGHHGLMGKQNLYEHSVRVPFIVVGPDVAKNAKNEANIYLQDVMPTTFLELVQGSRSRSMWSLIACCRYFEESRKNPIILQFMERIFRISGVYELLGTR